MLREIKVREPDSRWKTQRKKKKREVKVKQKQKKSYPSSMGGKKKAKKLTGNTKDYALWRTLMAIAYQHSTWWMNESLF